MPPDRPTRRGFIAGLLAAPFAWLLARGRAPLPPAPPPPIPRVIEPLGSVATYVYDAADRLTEVWDCPFTEDSGGITRYMYDLDSRPPRPRGPRGTRPPRRKPKG